MLRWALPVLLCLVGQDACAQQQRGGSGVPPSPHQLDALTNPLSTLKIRLGVPFLTHGPGSDWGDFTPTFFPKGDGTFYAYGANQVSWGTNVATLTTPTCGAMPCPSPPYSATFAGYISGNTLHVTSAVAGVIAIGQGVSAIGATAGTTITAGAGVTWTVSVSQTVASLGNPEGMQTFPTATTHAQAVGLTCNATQLSTMTQTFPSGSIVAIPPAVSSDSCGDWITSGFVLGGLCYAEVHNEGPADYRAFAESNESEGLWVSSSCAPGANWKPVKTAGSPGTIASSDIGVIPANLTGIGDGTMFLDGYDQYAYFYGSFFCSTATCDYHNVIARAPTRLANLSIMSSANISVAGQVFTFAGIPANNDRIVIGGTTITFLTSGASCASNSVAIAGSVSAQISDLYDCLTASADTNIAKYAYVTSSTTLTVGASLAPGQWQILYGGAFGGQALNNSFNATTQLPAADWYGVYGGNSAGYFPTQGFVGSSVATIPHTPYKALAIDYRLHGYWKYYSFGNIGGLALSIAQDYVHFYTYSWPLLNFDFQNFANRSDAFGGCVLNTPPDPSGTCGDLFLYSGILSDVDGTNTLSPSHATLWTMWTPPVNSLANRYIEGYPVTFSQRSADDIANGAPQAGVTLETYQNTSVGHPYSGQYRSTIVPPGPAPGGDYQDGWNTNSFLGYMMTNCPSSSNIVSCDSNGSQIAVRIEECMFGTGQDYALNIDNNGTTGSCPGGWYHVRTAGWMYRAPPNNVQTYAIYSCSNASPAYHFASGDPLCNGKTPLGLLGYTLAN